MSCNIHKSREQAKEINNPQNQRPTERNPSTQIQLPNAIKTRKSIAYHKTSENTMSDGV